MIVAICDDESIFRNNLKLILIEYKQKMRLHLDIVEFCNGNDLLNSNLTFDIVFLDYQMPGDNGLNVAKSLRLRHNICSIIFITSYPEFMIEAFSVNTFRFLIKPLDKGKLISAIDDYIKEKKMFSPITVNTYDGQRVINSEDIIYLEGDGKYCNIRTTNGFYHSSKTLSSVFKLLPTHCFFRTHKSYVVNLYCIFLISNNCITLNNNEKVKISHNNISRFKRAYSTFIYHFKARN